MSGDVFMDKNYTHGAVNYSVLIQHKDIVALKSGVGFSRVLKQILRDFPVNGAG